MRVSGRWVATWLALSACGRTEVISDDGEVLLGAVDGGVMDSGLADSGVRDGVVPSDSGTTLDGGDRIDAGTDAGEPLFDAGPSTRCPHVVWTGPMPIHYVGDTRDLPNWVTSLSRAWREFPDDSFEFTVPVTGRYRIGVDSGVPDLMLTFQNVDRSLHSARGCPSVGFLQLDQADIGPYGEARFDAGTRVLVWLSVPAWRPLMPAGPYELRVTPR